MIASRKIDPALVVRSPISGEVTDFNGPEGLLVQPGNAPAPFTVSNVSIKWMLADVIESDIPLLHLGQSVQVKVMAYPDRVFDGKISEELSVLLPDEGTLWLSMTISSFWRMKSSSIGDFAATTYGSPGSGISECAKMTSL